MDNFELTLETLDELRTKEWYKKLNIQRLQTKKQYEDKIGKLFETGEASDSQIAQLVGECLDNCNYSEDECRRAMFNRLKQELVAKARRHNTSEGDKRGIYRYKDRQVCIPMCRDLEKLNYFEHFSKSNRDTYDDMYQMVREQKYRVEHGIDNFVQVDLFDIEAM